MNLSLKMNKKEKKVQLKGIYKTNLDNLANKKDKESEEKELEKDILNSLKAEQNFILLYSPRTEYTNELEKEKELYNELKQNFDPITIKIIKKHFKERLGTLKKEEMIAILKNHLLGFIPNYPDRERIMIKLLSRLFNDINLNNNGELEWDEFTNYIINVKDRGEKTKTSISHSLKYYYKSDANIKRSEMNEFITNSFYIEKYNAIGIVEENKSYIKFYNANTCEKLRHYIDIKEIQGNIDLLQFSILNEKANRYLIKQEEEKKIKKDDLERMKMNLLIPSKIDFSNTFHVGRRAGLGIDNKGGETLLKFMKKRKEEKSGIIENFNLLNKKDLKIKNENKKLSVLCTCYIPEYDIIMISSTNNTITAWQFSKTEIKNVNTISDYKLVKNDLSVAILIASHPQYTMVWDSKTKYLYTGQKDGKILKWELTNPNPIIDDILDINVIKRRLGKSTKKKKENIYKEEAKMMFEKFKNKNQINDKINSYINEDKKFNVSITCLYILKKLQLLACSYYNGNIILWDTSLKEHRKYYSDQNTSVYSMVYDSINNLLYTCGFSHDIYVYDPYIDGNCVYKLTGHAYSIKNIDLNEKENELITFDIVGNIKIWDLTSMTNFQNIKINEDEEENPKKIQPKNKIEKLIPSMKMLYLKNLKKIFIYGFQNVFFESNKSNYPELADDQGIFCCHYDYASLNLITFCAKKIKVWNILTGKIRYTYDYPMGSEITAIAVDKNCKRAYLGDNTGKIKNINLKTGALIKNLESHSSEIKFLIHSQELNLVVSCCTDNIIKIHNDHDLLNTEIIKELKINDINVTALNIINNYSRLAIGFSNGIIKFYDIEHYHYDTDLEPESSLTKYQVMIIRQLKDLEIVFCCFSNGVNKFVVTPPSNAKYKSIYQFKADEKNDSIYITYLDFDDIKHHVFMGDILGNLYCYDFSQIYQIVNELYKINKNKSIYTKDSTIMKKNLHYFNNLNLNFIWKVDAHKESIRHIHYIDIEPRIIITTSYDLTIKIFDANNGYYKDEFRQISNRMKSIPIGIKYYALDPFGEDDITEGPKSIFRKDILNFKFSQRINESNGPNIIEIAKQITEYNAKEKLWFINKNINLPENMSNEWKLDININKIKEKEEEEFNKLLNKVKEIEKTIIATESTLLKKSIYSDSYRPKYIEDMNDIDKIKELNKTIQSRLRSVKMAVIKANQNTSKMIELSKKQKILEDLFKKKDKRKMRCNSSYIPKYLYKNDNKLSSIDEKNEDKNIEKEENMNRNNSLGVENTVLLKKNLLLNKAKSSNPINNLKLKSIFPEIKSQYAMDRTKLKNTEDIFNKCQNDFSQGYKEIFRPFKKLFKKTKDTKKIVRVKSSIISDGYKRRYFNEETDKKNKKINILAKCLRELEQNSIS